MPDEQEELAGVSLEDDASPSEPIEQAPEPYSNQFFNSEQWINSVPEQDRPIVQKYVKDVFSGWDAGVNKALEERANKIKQYEELGKFEELQQARNLYYNLRGPQGEQILGRMVREYFNHYGAEAGMLLMKNMGYEMPDNQEPVEKEWDYSHGEPDINDVFRQNVTSELEELRAFRAEIEAERQQAEGNRVLDGILEQVHTARPDIPQKFLVQGIAAGNQPDQIIALFDEIKGNIGSQTARKTPPVVMGGTGGVPSGQVDVSKLNKEQRLQYMQQMLEASGQ